MKESSTQRIFSSEFLEEIRDKFLYVDWDPYSGKRVYLEASGGSLRLRSVLETLAKEAAIPDELFRFNPASDVVTRWVDKGIEDVRIFLGAKSGEIIAAHSATETMFRAVDTITSSIPGTNIVTTELEHPALLGATHHYAQATGKEWRVAKLSKETSSVPIEAILEKVDKNTCLLAFQHGSNQTGAVNEVKTIIAEARKIKPDLYVLVDAVQYAPHGQIDVEDYGADVYAFGPYKSYCVKGIGFAHISERLSKLPHENLLGKPESNWVLGSPAHMMYACWSATVDYLCWVGSRFTESTDRRDQVVAAKDAIHAHMKALLRRAIFGSDEVEGLRQQDHVTVCGMPEDIGNRLCIFLFRLEGMSAPEAVNRYNREHGIRLAARIRDAYSTVPLKALGWSDAVRLSACHYNTPEEIDLFLKATQALAP
ncbi:MAG: aminotransferase class V-fold PLP-dependent enzyme [Candidatus Aminicenantales bacterium]